MTWRGETAKAQARLQKHTVLQLVLKPTAVFLTLQISPRAPGMTKVSPGKPKKKIHLCEYKEVLTNLTPEKGGRTDRRSCCQSVKDQSGARCGRQPSTCVS